MPSKPVRKSNACTAYCAAEARERAADNDYYAARDASDVAHAAYREAFRKKGDAQEKLPRGPYPSWAAYRDAHLPLNYAEARLREAEEVLRAAERRRLNAQAENQAAQEVRVRAGRAVWTATGVWADEACRCAPKRRRR